MEVILRVLKQQEPQGRQIYPVQGMQETQQQEGDTMTMVQNPNELDRYLGQVAKQPQAILGYLLWYSVSSLRVTHADAAARLEAVGLKEFVPGFPADSDVFRRVFENGSRRSFDTSMEGVTENLLVRDVVRKGERLVKRIVSEIVDAGGERLSYDEVVDVTFNKNHPDGVEVKALAENDNALNFARSLATEYHSTRGCIGAQAVREIIRRTLEESMATSVRENGGVFFVGPDYLDKLQALEGFCEQIDGAVVHPLPLLDDVKQREMVKRALEAEVTEEVIKLQVEVVGLLNQEGEIGSSKFKSYHKRFLYVNRKIKEYKDLLTEQTDVAGDRLEILSKQMGALLNKVA